MFYFSFLPFLFNKEKQCYLFYCCGTFLVVLAHHVAPSVSFMVTTYHHHCHSYTSFHYRQQRKYDGYSIKPSPSQNSIFDATTFSIRNQQANLFASKSYKRKEVINDDNSTKKQTKMSTPNQKNKKWHIWKTIRHLEEHGITTITTSPKLSSGDDNDDGRITTEMVTKQVISILKQWANTIPEQQQSILNKKTLLHEIEESIKAIEYLLEWMDSNDSEQQQPIILVDVCCGKGIFSMLASYIFQQENNNNQQRRRRIHKIIMLDKDPHVNWNHIDYANQYALQEHRPTIEYWRNCNLHDIDQIIDRFEHDVLTTTTVPTTTNTRKSTTTGNMSDDNDDPSSTGNLFWGVQESSPSTAISSLPRRNQLSLSPVLAFVGIHLCKTLSPTCIGIVNRLGPTKCPFLCLAPCCLPRAVASAYSSSLLLPSSEEEEGGGGGATPVTKSSFQQKKKKKKSRPSTTMIPIQLYESPSHRKERQVAQQRRKNAMKRGFMRKSTTIGGTTATINNTNVVVTTEKEDIDYCGCYLCQSVDHSVQSCGLLPTNEKERYDILSKAAVAEKTERMVSITTPPTSSSLSEPICWRCGQVGHFKVDCPSKQSSGKPSLIQPPTLDMDVTSVLTSKYPFDTYCKLLMATIQRNNVQLMETGLLNNHGGMNKILPKQQNSNDLNWNQNRKSLYIVATQNHTTGTKDLLPKR